MVQIIGFFPGRKAPSEKDWSNQDLAEFYRVEAALLQAGLHVETERGLTDEGDPWFVFCHRDEGDTIVHFARIDDQYVVAAPLLPNVLRGTNLREIIQKFVSENPVSIPLPEPGRRDNVLFHPAALLTIFVATVLITSLPSESIAAAAEDTDESEGMGDSPPSEALSSEFEALDDEEGRLVGEKTLLLAAVAVAVEMARQQSAEPETTLETNLAKVSLASQPSQETAEPSSKASDLLDLSKGHLLSNQVADEEALLLIEDEDVFGKAVQHIGESTHPNEITEIPFDAALDVHHAAPPPIPEHFEPYEAFQEIGLEKPLNVDAKASGSEPVGVVLQKPSDGGAREWIEARAEAEGIKLVALEEAEVPLLNEVIDKNNLADASYHDFAQPKETLPAFDEAARKAVLHFMCSDDDIAMIGNEQGIVVFDQSDLASSEPLSVRSWAFDDESMISILGHTDTIESVMALVA